MLVINLLFKSIEVKAIVVLFLLTSCAYNPYLTDVPLISKKGDTRIEGGITITPPLAHVSVSYGLTEQVAIQASGGIGGDNIYYAQGAAGYFKKLKNQKIMEMYGGFGYGYGNDYKNSKPGRLYGNYQVYFTQFNYGKTNGEFAHIDYGLGVKSGYIHARMTDANFYDYYSEEEPYRFCIDNGLLIEPVFFLRFGGQKLKFQAEVGGCWIFKFTNTDKKFPFFPLNIGLGVSYSI